MDDGGAARRPASRSSTAHGATGAEVGASRAAPTAARALRVVELLAAQPHRPWTLAELRRELGYSHGNLHAILATLVAMGYLRRDAGSRDYRLGPALLGIGDAARSVYPVVDQARPHLEGLAGALGTESQAAMVIGRSILVVARYGPHLPAGQGVRVGERFPLTPPMGSTLVAWAPPDQLEHYLATADGKLTDAEITAHRESLGAVRRRGYSVHVYRPSNQPLRETAARMVDEGRDEADHEELTALAHQLARQDYLPREPERSSVAEGVQFSAPVFGPDGRTELSVGVAFAGPDVDPTTVAAAPTAVVRAATAITQEIGGRAPTDVLA